MSAPGESTAHIIQSLVVNLAIAVIKAVAAVLTKSGSMLAEALHSAADCGNQVLLLVGVRGARRPPDAEHPFGYGRDVYFWSFMVALLLFTGGGVFSIYEGVHKIREPEKVEKVWLGLLILAVSIALETAATISNVREINRRRGSKPFMRYLRETKDSDLVVVFGENSAAVLGLAIAMVALFVADLTKDGRWDGIGSLSIGVVLVAVAVFLAVEVKSLLLGEAADPEIEAAARDIARDHANLRRILNIVTVQQGPGEVIVSMKVAFADGLTIEEVCRCINDLEGKLRAKRPEIRWLYVEPDLPRETA
ncbi:MAG: cation diffusion facilitator family transporter [Deltaproteobacteria bacterium]|nr:cation diffusion facilitator family transporter [Deltaproteobacteria bacterium]